MGTRRRGAQHQAGLIDQAASDVLAADWSGDASSAYSMTSSSVSLNYVLAGGTCQEVAGACRQLSHEIRDCQHEARQAIRDAEHALDRLHRAQRRAAHAGAQAAMAQDDATAAEHRGIAASAAGPAGAHAVASAQADHDRAVKALGAAQDEQTRAARDEKAARTDLHAAQARGKRANTRAHDAARKASKSFSLLAAAAQTPALVSAPVPVSLRGASPRLAGLGSWAMVGGPLSDRAVFTGPGRYPTPAQARAAQIAKAEAEQEDATAQPEHHALVSLHTLGVAAEWTWAHSGTIADVAAGGVCIVQPELCIPANLAAGAVKTIQTRAESHSVSDFAKRESWNVATSAIGSIPGANAEMVPERLGASGKVLEKLEETVGAKAGVQGYVLRTYLEGPHLVMAGLDPTMNKQLFENPHEALDHALHHEHHS